MKCKNVLLMTMCALAGTATALTVSDVSAHARYPWQSVIDVDFTVSDAKASDLFKVSISAKYANGTTNLYARTFVSEPICARGVNRVSWDVGADYPGLKVDDIQVAVTLAPINIDSLDVYMVIDLSSGPESKRYPVSYTFTAPTLVPTNDLVACAADPNRTTKLWLKRVKESEFKFGGTDGNKNGIFTVRLSPYYIGVFELTQKQWALVMNAWPSKWANETYRAARPVETVNYEDVIGHNNWPNSKEVAAESFVGRMRARTGLSTFNLPTEAQWECACRSGRSGSVPANEDNARYEKNNGDITDFMGDPNNGTAIVGSYNANPLGFYDFNGNVLEMCLDAYASDADLKDLYAELNPVIDPIGPAVNSTARYHATRGGYYDNSHLLASAYYRAYGASTITGKRDHRIGLRVAVSPEWK
jgi:formylglycine-generating enzyme required for sulfatase activity